MKSVNLSENFSIFINLLKTTMGCGILKYPTLYYEYGIIPALILTVISAFASYCGIFLYIDLNDKYGLGNTLSTVSLHFAPYLKVLADIVVIAKCYMVGVAYLIYIGEQLVFLLKYFMIDLSPKIALGIVLALISPFIFISKIDKLKYTSTAGLVAILMLVSASYYRLKSNEIPHSISYDTGNRSYIKNLCHFVFSFTCHQNIFTLQNSMENYNKRHLKITSGFSFVSAVVIYSIFGWISYIALGNNLKTSYLEAQPEDHLKVAISIFYICLVSLSIPLQTNPCKSYLLNAVNPDFLVKESYFYVRTGFSLFLTLSIYIFAICGINFDKICGFVGGTFSTFMCFIFAAVYHFLSFGIFKNILNTVLAIIAMTYGVLSFTAVLLAK
ncbi:Putative amino acid permease [Nosema bombycis CQ1]|uniref:Putative amino acid permease n=1 Tax=Nosema bombycis (strain CQ1 / CVCC 102059) TaxID=578461 RepID=R0MDJ9_NOSB1|nr:Putative amino acid permease [Nosema bombycis CQ1]|eukprot:EOB12155.1 Putative amino acid permease [Nosema bombycis CQ1]